MLEASQTLVPTGEILAIVVVGVVSTAFLISAPLLIGESLQRRANRPASQTPQTGAEPARTADLGDGVPGRRQPTAADAARQGVAPADAAAMAVRHDIPAQRREPAPRGGQSRAEQPRAGQTRAGQTEPREQTGHAQEHAEDPAAEAPTEPIPATESPRPAMPAQRSDDSDRARRSLAGPVSPEEDEGRRE